MSPEYLDELADLADPGQLWRLAGLEQKKLPPILRKQLDTGVALRRHAEHIRCLQTLIGTGRSLRITPLSPNGTALDVVAAPAKYRNPPLPADPQPSGMVEINRRGKR